MSIKRFKGLPLLSRELIEQAGKVRTYGFRVIYTLALFITAGIYIYSESYRNGQVDPFRILGRGDEFLTIVLVIQFFTVYIFLPAIACGAISGEKERQTLPLLFLTRLSPWAIIWEKTLGCLIPFLFLILPSVPLLMLGYSFGGVKQGLVWGSVWALILAAVQTTLISIFCSAYFRKTVTAFLMSYGIGLALFMGPPLVISIVNNRIQIPTVFGVRYVWFFAAFPPYLTDIIWQASFPKVLLFSIPMVLLAAVFAFAARWALVSRAFQTGDNRTLKTLQLIDRGTSKIKKRLTGQTLKVAGHFPTRKPVQWREDNKNLFGITRYQIYATSAILLIVFLGLTWAGSYDSWWRRDLLACFHFGIWIAVLLIALLRSTSLISSERSSETLNILLTTPISNRDLLDQKTASLWRFLRLLSIPAIVFLIGELVLRDEDEIRLFGGSETSLYLICTATTAIIYVRMVSWVGIIAGLRSRTQIRAIVASLSFVLLWIALPFAILIPIFVTMNPPSHSPIFGLCLASPATIVTLNEFGDLDEIGSPFIVFVLNTALYGTCLYLLKRYCLRNLSRFLGRKDALTDLE